MDDAAWTTGTVLVEGTRLHFHRMGGSGRPVLLLLHGITDDGSCWTRVARDLEADFDIVMPDARGHGRSDSVGPDLSVARLASDVAGLLDELAIAEALVFGHSMGAITAVELAASRPDLVRGCILEDPPFGVLAAPSPERVAEMRTEIASWSTLPAADRHELAAAQNPGWSREETDSWADAKALVDPDVVGHLGSIRRADWRPALERMRCPGLLITGDADLGAIVTTSTAREVGRLWPAGRVVHIGGSGHCVHRDRWEATMTEVRAFLREQVVSTSSMQASASGAQEEDRGS